MVIWCFCFGEGNLLVEGILMLVSLSVNGCGCIEKSCWLILGIVNGLLCGEILLEGCMFLILECIVWSSWLKYCWISVLFGLRFFMNDKNFLFESGFLFWFFWVVELCWFVFDVLL